jgi:hypothetical protein
MIHTDKYLMVPAAATQSNKPVDHILNNLDTEMMQILVNTDLPPDIKYAQYSQLLHRHRMLLQDRNKPYEIPIIDRTPTVNSVNESEILNNIPKKRLTVAKSLIEFISKQPNICIKDNNEIEINGKLIKNSNIVDIIHDFSRDRKSDAPIGANIVARELRNASIYRKQEQA